MSARCFPPAGRIYAIADAQALGPIPLPVAVGALAAAGIGWIQIRAKRFTGADLYRATEASLAAASGTGAALWLDDRADVAALLPVAGVHVGQRDLPPAAVRRAVGKRVWIGRSTHDEEQLRRAADDPEVDAVAIGPIFPTTGKERPDPVVGLRFLERARALTAKPLIAIGGIDAGNVADVLAAGADVAAVLGAVCRGEAAGREGVEARARRLLAAAG